MLDRLDKKTYQTPGTGTNAARSQSNHLEQSPSKRNKKKKKRHRRLGKPFPNRNRNQPTILIWDGASIEPPFLERKIKQILGKLSKSDFKKGDCSKSFTRVCRCKLKKLKAIRNKISARSEIVRWPERETYV